MKRSSLSGLSQICRKQNRKKYVILSLSGMLCFLPLAHGKILGLYKLFFLPSLSFLLAIFTTYFCFFFSVFYTPNNRNLLFLSYRKIFSLFLNHLCSVFRPNRKKPSFRIMHLWLKYTSACSSLVLLLFLPWIQSYYVCFLNFILLSTYFWLSLFSYTFYKFVVCDLIYVFDWIIVALFPTKLLMCGLFLPLQPG